MIYTLLVRLGVLPLAIFFLLLPLVDGLNGWLRMHDIIPPKLEDAFPVLFAHPLASFAAYLVIIDFVMYWLHRWQHRFGWWWAVVVQQKALIGLLTQDTVFHAQLVVTQLDLLDARQAHCLEIDAQLLPGIVPQHDAVALEEPRQRGINLTHDVPSVLFGESYPAWLSLPENRRRTKRLPIRSE